MIRLQFFSVAAALAAACGGSSAAEPGASGATHSGAEHGSPGDVEPGAGEEPREGEFQLRTSEDAEHAHGERPSEIEATATHAAMRLFVVHPETGPIRGVVIKMTAPDGTAYYTGETDSLGYAEVLVPAGQRYEMEYLSLGREFTSASVEVPQGPHQDIRLTMRHRRWRPPPRPAPPPPPPPPEGAEPPPPPAPVPRGLVLEGITFASGSADIEPASHARLDRMVEYMTHRTSPRIRISGHTDNVGGARRNRRLSEERAQAVVDYLVAHGIDASRLEAVGYGDTRPVASNDTEDGRQQNRRIEADEL